MEIKFNNNKTILYENAIEKEEYYNGSSRRTLTFTCLKNSIGVDELNTILSDENNTKRITLINGEITNIYDDFTLKLKVGIEPVLVKNETSNTAALYEDRIIFKLGKLTYTENQLKKIGVNK